MAYMQARYKPGSEVSGFATTLIVGGTFVKVAADKTTAGDYSITTCGAGDSAMGVAINDSAPTTEPATSVERRIDVVRRGAIARVTAGGTIAAGATVGSDAAGKAVTYASGTKLGIAMNAATNGTVVEVDLI